MSAMGDTARLELIAIPDLPMVVPGDDLVDLVLDRLDRIGERLIDGDVVVVAQKIVSKAEDRMVRLGEVVPSPEAESLAQRVGKDPRLVELILSESRRVVRAEPGVLIVEHRLGLVMANAGVDQSNVVAEGEPVALLLPRDPDGSAEHLRAGFHARTGRRVAVLINDSFGRPWRIGTVGVAIGSAGLPALLDQRGMQDLFGRTLRVTMVAIADEVAAAASLLMGQAAESRPVVVLRGLTIAGAATPASALVRPSEQDLFR